MPDSGGFADAATPFTPALRCHGVVIPLDPDADGDILTPAIQGAIRSERYEAREASLLADVVEPGDRVLEIGAGIGVISTLAARAAPIERIVAIEANPRLVPVIRRVHQANGVERSAVLNAVLGTGSGGTMPFYLREDFWMSSLSPGPEPFVERVDVPLADLSDLIQVERPNLIICDVEGAEETLFEHADLSGVDRVYMELHDHLTGIGGIARVFATMATAGLAYDPRGSAGPVVLFRRLHPGAPPRSYRG